MTDPKNFKTALLGMKLFAEFTDEEIDTLIDLADVRNVAQGELIVRQDDPGDCMFLIVVGTAAVKHHRDGHDFQLATIEAGDFFGEIALVDEGPRSADVEAVTPCQLLALSQGTMRALAGVYPSAAFKLLLAIGRVLVTRLRTGNQKYIDSLLVHAK